MNPEQIRARLAEISAKLDGVSASAEGYTPEQITEVEELHAEFEQLTTQLQTAEKMEAMKNVASASAPRKLAPAPAAATPRIQVGASATDKFGGFQSSGEFFMAVKTAGQTGTFDKRFNNVMYEKEGETGGILVPEEIRTAILKKLESQESLFSKVRQFPVSGNALSLPIDETQPWNSGVVAYWVAEGAKLTPSQFGFTSAHWRLHKLGAMVVASDELLDDAVAIEGYIKEAAPAAIMHKLNESILTGNGVGKPQGILNSPFTLTVAKETAQAADTFTAENAIKMYSKLIPSSRPNAVWYVNAAVEEQLAGLKNANGDYIYLGGGVGVNQAPYATLLGRPVVPMMSAMPALGDKGDVLLGDLSYYYAIVKAGAQIKQAQSIHVYFDRELTAFRFTMRVDGSVPFKAPVTTQYGGFAMSAFVTLADRA